MAERYDDAFTVVLKGELSRDASANARLLETNIALPYIKGNWLFGNGDLSNQWEGGYKGRLGYFYPSDIGMIGIIFIYGVAGLLFFYAQYIFAIRYGRAKRKTIYNPLIDASKVYLLYMFIQSFVTGNVASSLSTSLFFIALLYASSAFFERNGERLAQGFEERMHAQEINGRKIEAEKRAYVAAEEL